MGDHSDHAVAVTTSVAASPGRAVEVAISLAHARSTTVRDRLIQAADEEFAEFGTLTGRFEAVAHRAGVSRATAYRQIGSVTELMTQIGLRRAQKYIAALRAVMEVEQGALAKLRAAMIYGARVLPDEPIVMNLIAQQFTSGRDPELYEMVNDLIRPTMAAGQRRGEIRNDIDLDTIIDYLIEQSYLTMQPRDRPAQAVARRFRLFIEPAITPPTIPARKQRAPSRANR